MGPLRIPIDRERPSMLVSIGIIGPDRREVHSMPHESRVLLVANRTANTRGLREAVMRLAEQGDARFHLLVPAHPRGLHRVVDPEVAGREEAKARLESALPSLGEAAGREL